MTKIVSLNNVHKYAIARTFKAATNLTGPSGNFSISRFNSPCPYTLCTRNLFFNKRLEHTAYNVVYPMGTLLITLTFALYLFTYLSILYHLI